MRRFGEPPLCGQSYRPRPGVYAVLPERDRVLVTWQGAGHQEFQLPGGGIDPGESPLQALHREVLEETGWRIAAPRRLGVFKRFAYMPEYDLWAEKLCTIYVARPVRPLHPPLERDHMPVWIRPQDAEALLAPVGDASFVARVFG